MGEPAGGPPDRKWFIRVPAEAAQIPLVRRGTLEILARECPPVDAEAAALVVTELGSNVVRHAYPEGAGMLEVEIRCDDRGATVVVRDWGVGFGRSRRHGLGQGMVFVEALADDVQISRGGVTEVAARLNRLQPAKT
jgi:anti-sigma regulatory factor (Ser/Thr protein kinase)